MQFYVWFSALWKLINDDRKNMTGRRRHVAWPDFKFLEQKFCRMQSSERSEQENF